MLLDKKNKKLIIDKLKYKIDNFIQKGVLNLMLVLAVLTLIIILLFAIVICIFNIGGKSIYNFKEVLFYSASTIINRWMPDATLNVGYYLIMAVAAIIGIFITGALISIITNALDESLENLKYCDSAVLEEKHIIILGFIDKNYVLVKELIKSNISKKTNIVIVDNKSCEEMSKKLYQNVDVPKNIKIMFRTCDIFDSKSYEKLAMNVAKEIIVNLNTNVNIVKTFLSIISYQEKYNCQVPVYAILENDSFNLTTVFNDNKNFKILFIKRLIVRLIAQGFVDYNISNVYTQLFTFDDKQLYVEKVDELYGKTFNEIVGSIDNAIPLGIYNENGIKLNPKANEIYKENDKLILCEEQKNSYIVNSKLQIDDSLKKLQYVFMKSNKGVCTIFGFNDILMNIIEEIYIAVNKIIIVVDQNTICIEENKKILQNIKNKYEKVEFMFVDYWEEEGLKEVACESNHIIVLSSHNGYEEDEKEEVVNMIKVFKLRKLREKYNLQYNMIVELLSRDNKAIDMDDKNIDFIIANEIPSMLLAQISEIPELYDVYVELLSNSGNNVIVRKFSEINNEIINVHNLRLTLYEKGYLLIGFIFDNKKITWATNLSKEIKVTKDTGIVLIGKEDIKEMLIY